MSGEMVLYDVICSVTHGWRWMALAYMLACFGMFIL